MTKLKVKHVNESSWVSPYIYDDSAYIFLNEDTGKLFTSEGDGNSSTGWKYAWSILNDYRTDIINEILDEISPLCQEILDVTDKYDETSENNDDIVQKLDELDHNVQVIINLNYGYNEDYRISLINWYDWFINYESPSGARQYIKDGKDTSDGVLIEEDADDVYEEIMSNFLEDASVYDVNDAAKAIEKIYESYKTDHFEDDFWNDFMPNLIESNDDDDDYAYSVKNKHVYFGGELIL